MMHMTLVQKWKLKVETEIHPDEERDQDSSNNGTELDLELGNQKVGKAWGGSTGKYPPKRKTSNPKRYESWGFH